MAAPRRNLTVPDDILAIFVKEHPTVFDPDTHRVLFALRAVAQRVNDRANEWLAPLDLTVGKYNYLVALGSVRDQSLTLNEIAGLIHTKSATVTQMIAALEHDGLVERTSNPVDGRSTIATLTSRGKALLRKAMVAHHLRIEECMTGFSRDERRTLFSLLLKLGDSFAEKAEPVKLQRMRTRRLRTAVAAR
jgi:DNA-binding MarR family transcriptional regulator